MAENEKLNDELLVQDAVKGDRQALEALITRYQQWIYNVVLRMVWYPQDAEDVTQEILIKMITNLSSFRGESKFRTWLYRIVSNHVLNMRKRKAESIFVSLDAYGKNIDESPDRILADAKSSQVDQELLIEETKIGCMMGMLLCLDREHRLVFILSEVFDISDAEGSQIMSINRDNYRQQLHRSRKKISNFMQERCG